MAKKRVAVILSGCGVYDGSEVHESSAVMVHLSRAGAEVRPLSPAHPQKRFFTLTLHPTTRWNWHRLRTVTLDSDPTLSFLRLVLNISFSLFPSAFGNNCHRFHRPSDHCVSSCLFSSLLPKVCFVLFQVQLYAPNVNQMHVVDHKTGQPTEEVRNVLVESSRIARGNIKDLTELVINDTDALIIPGKYPGLCSSDPLYIF